MFESESPRGTEWDTKGFTQQLERAWWERCVVSRRQELTCSAKPPKASVCMLVPFYLVCAETLIGAV